MLFGSIQTNRSSRPFETSSWISESDSGEIAGWWNIRDLISPPRTHSLPVKNGGRETVLSFWDTLFSGAPVCFREGNIFHKLITKWIKLSSECNFVEIWNPRFTCFFWFSLLSLFCPAHFSVEKNKNNQHLGFVVVAWRLWICGLMPLKFNRVSSYVSSESFFFHRTRSNGWKRKAVFGGVELVGWKDVETVRWCSGWTAWK